ncbi:MAG: tetratricopeptide repeat protein [Bacteroidetes bacterium]|nr:tetratricopeptide repeat protein [Bacteroidota bacterium]
MVKAKTKERSGNTGKFHQKKFNDRLGECPPLLCKSFPLLWFATVAFILFGQSINFNYTYLDDQTLILSNLDKLGEISFIKNAFSEDVFHSGPGNGYYYRPVLTLSFIADAMIGRGNFAMFHFSNIVFHLLATFLLFLFFVETGFDRIRSFLFALLFLVHPLVTQAVAWVPGRNDILLAIFILSSFLFWLKFIKTGDNRYLLLHLSLFLIALFTKESAIVLPVMIILYSMAIMRTPLKNYSIAGPAWVIITFIWAVIRYYALGGGSEVPFSAQIFSVVKNLPAVIPFLGKALFPFDLSVFPIIADMKVSIKLGIVATSVLIALVMITKPKQWFFYFFGILWFLIFLVPSFVSVNNQIPKFSEHRIYLSLVGILFFILSCNPVKKTNFSKPIPVTAFAGVAMIFSILTFLHTRHFRDNFIFWQNAVETSPSNAFNYNNLGAMYYLSGDLEKAEPLFRKALQVNPYEPMANSNTGLVCMNTNRPEEAEKLYLEEIRVNPHYDHAYYNLGLLYFNNSRTDEAISKWEKTLEVNPCYADAYKALLFAYKQLHRPGDYTRIEELAQQNGVKPE